jgi:hypothetical protein
MGQQNSLAVARCNAGDIETCFQYAEMWRILEPIVITEYRCPGWLCRVIFVTKIFQGTGIEGIVNAAKTRFSRVQRFSPEASRNASSEVYLICRNKLPAPRQEARGRSVADDLDDHLTKAGIIDRTAYEDDEPILSGFRVMKKREE